MLYHKDTKYDFTYTEKVKALLDENITDFRDLTDFYKVKKTGRVITVKSNLFTMASNAIFKRVQHHIDDEEGNSLEATFLREQLGHQYREIVRILFDVGDEYVFKKKTKVYRVKKEVIDYFLSAFSDATEQQILLDGFGKKVLKEGITNINAIKDYQYSKDGATTKKSKGLTEGLNIPAQVKVNVKHLTEGMMIYDELKHSVIGNHKLSKRTESILRSAGVNMKKLTAYKVDKWSMTVRELLMRTNQLPFKYGHIFQLYGEREFGGRLYSEGANGMLNIPKHIKHIMMSGMGYYDYDLVNAHWNILYQLNRHYGGGMLLHIENYNKNVKKIRKELAKDVGIDEENMKVMLVALLYGASININDKYWSVKKRKMVDTDLLQKLRSWTGDEQTARKIGKEFCNHTIVRGLWGDIKTGRDTILKNVRKTGKGNNAFIENLTEHKIKISVKGRGGKVIKVSGGRQLAHILQGVETFILHSVIKKMQYDADTDFLVPYHDGWVCKGSINKNSYERMIEEKTRDALTKYDGIVCDEGLKVKISGGKLVNPFRGK
jgi:hypothetical protein